MSVQHNKKVLHVYLTKGRGSSRSVGRFKSRDFFRALPKYPGGRYQTLDAPVELNILLLNISFIIILFLLSTYICLKVLLCFKHIDVVPLVMKYICLYVKTLMQHCCFPLLSSQGDLSEINI